MTRLSTLTLILCMAVAGCSQKKDKADRAKQEEEINDYPDIVLRFTDGKEVSARQLTGNNVFVMFQPDCDHCQQEAIHIEQRLNEFKDYNLYFITSAPMENIVAFAESFDLATKDKVRFAWTSTEGVLTYYGPINVPSIYIYSDKHLKAFFNGQTDLDTIFKAL